MQIRVFFRARGVGVKRTVNGDFKGMLQVSARRRELSAKEGRSARA
jgi:hypothetical protein